MPALDSALNYFDVLCSGQLPANLLQIQRDFFGAHGFEQLDLPVVVSTLTGEVFMKIYDVTLPLSEHLPVWPGDPAVKVSLTASLAAGDSCNVSRIEMGAHSGTHVDAPSHFLQDGGTMETIPLETLLGPCVVVEVNASNLIEKTDLLEFDFSGQRRVLFKTSNSQLWKNKGKEFDKDFVSLGLSAAEYLVEQGVELVGIDYLSIEGFYAKGNAVHSLLLGNGIVILEGLTLAAVPEGEYGLICLPLRLLGCEGAPARVLLTV